MDVAPWKLALAATAVAWVPPIVFGALWPDYRAGRDFISELGAAGAPHAPWVNTSFALTGALFVATCAALGRVRPSLRMALTLVSAIGWSYLVAAVAPCDAGCPADGTATQAVHNTMGALGYLTGGIGLLFAARPLAAEGRHGRAWMSRAAGGLAIAGLVGMGAPELGDVRGLIQRVVELGAFAWLVSESRATSVSSVPRPASAPA